MFGTIQYSYGIRSEHLARILKIVFNGDLRFLVLRLFAAGFDKLTSILFVITYNYHKLTINSIEVGFVQIFNFLDTYLYFISASKTNNVKSII